MGKMNNLSLELEELRKNTNKLSEILSTMSLIDVIMSLTVDSISLSLFVLFLSSSSSKDKLFIFAIGTSSFLYFFDINGLY